MLLRDLTCELTRGLAYGLACGRASVLRLRRTASSKGGGEIEGEGEDGSHGGLSVGEVEGSGDVNRYDDRHLAE